MQTLYQWDDLIDGLAVGVAAFAAAYLTDGLAIAVLSGLIFFLVSLACFEAARTAPARGGGIPADHRYCY